MSNTEKNTELDTEALRAATETAKKWRKPEPQPVAFAPNEIPQLLPGTEPFFFPGNKIGCLLIHGFTGAPDSMRSLGEHLASKGYTVHGPRLPHHATHPADMNRSHWHDWYLAAADGWHLLQGHCDQIFIVGLSMGGATALLLASQFPTAGVITLSAPLRLNPDWRLSLARLIWQVYPFNPPLEPNWKDLAQKETHVSYPVWPVKAVAELSDYLEIVQAHLHQVTAPALMIHSKTDITVPVDNMDLIYSEIGSKKKESLVVEESIHVITRGVAKELVADRVAQFIAHELNDQQSILPPPRTVIVRLKNWWQNQLGRDTHDQN